MHIYVLCKDVLYSKIASGGHFSMHLANVAGIPGSPAAVCHFLMDAIQINVVLKLRDMLLKI